MIIQEESYELSESEGIKRLKEKAKNKKNKNIVAPVDEEEPTGLLSGGPEHLDLGNEEDYENIT